jgi:predicted ATP-grasp superfamily ATP-dependent carboligase
MSRKVDNRKKLLVSKINSAKLKSECEKLQELLKKTINSLRNQDEHEPQDFSSRI